MLKGCTIEDSIIGVRATVRDATLRRTLMMGADDREPFADGPPVGIGAGSIIQDAIVDKNARIGRDVRIVNEDKLQEGEGDGWVIHDGVVVIPKNAVIPDGTVI